MRLVNRLSGQAATVTIILTGNTYEARESIKGHGFRFARSGSFCQQIADLGPLWYSAQDVPMSELGASLAWTKELMEHAIDVVLVDGGYI